ncbi:FKBP-type peptidyl-prolyl cis-trans isomerase [Ekhidna sp.]|uniref:FKBP-type peptidyl-prolyl cis-trans isomerase n=1 Tax=Ekhidna sp. TaxID=2608089 RepID=UPI003BA867F3
MNEMRKGLLAIFVGFILLACGDGDVLIQEDPRIQFIKDSTLIIDYLNENGYDESQIGNTPSGIRYVILDSGDMVSIDESDIVTYDYVGKFLSDSVFDTSIEVIGDSVRMALLEDSVGLSDKSVHEAYLIQFPEEREYKPLVITYTSNGWTSPSGDGVVDGFFEGMEATLKYLKTGGEVLIVVPSAEAYGINGRGLIPPNTVLAFNILPVSVTKQ